MDDAKALLDSLMGQARNVPLKEAKKRKGNNFKEDNVCKFYLLGFCPQHDELFRNTKMHLGECAKIHSDAMKEELEAHPDKVDFKSKWCTTLSRYLASVVRMADDSIARQKRDQEIKNKELEDHGPSEVAQQEIAKIRDNCNWYLGEAEKCAEQGKIKEATEWRDHCEKEKFRADDYEEKSKKAVNLEICEICGIRPEEFYGTLRTFSHAEGKVHRGFVKVREWVERAEEMQKEFDTELAKNGKDKRDNDVRDTDGEKRDDGREKKEASRERGRRDRSQDDRRGRGERRDKDRSRGRDGERDSKGGYDRRRGGDDRGRDDRQRGDSRGRNRGDAGYDTGDRGRRYRSRSREQRRD